MHSPVSLTAHRYPNRIQAEPLDVLQILVADESIPVRRDLILPSRNIRAVPVSGVRELIDDPVGL